MNISKNWLKKYVDFTLTDEELSATLTMAGLEVEGVTKTGSIPDGVVTAKILERNKHENSDHLSVCKVDKGMKFCRSSAVPPTVMPGTLFRWRPSAQYSKTAKAHSPSRKASSAAWNPSA